MGNGGRKPCVQILATLPLTRCVILDKSLPSLSLSVFTWKMRIKESFHHGIKEGSYESTWYHAWLIRRTKRCFLPSPVFPGQTFPGSLLLLSLPPSLCRERQPQARLLSEAEPTSPVGGWGSPPMLQELPEASWEPHRGERGRAGRGGGKTETERDRKRQSGTETERGRGTKRETETKT